MARLKSENYRLDSEEKFCEKCDSWKRFKEYHRETRAHLGLSSFCKDCNNNYYRVRHKNPEVKAKRRARYIKNSLENPDFKEKQKKISKKYYESILGRAKTIMKGVDDRCKKKNMECDIDIGLIEDRIISGFCQVTNLPFDLTTKQDSKKNPYAPSIDRIDQSKGYTRDNVRIVLWQVNLMKNELSDSELLKMCERIVDNAESLYL